MIQARAVGNAVNVEEEGMAGNYCSFGLSDHRAASDVAEGINKAIRDAVAEAEGDADDLRNALAEAEAECEKLRKQVEHHSQRAGKAVELAHGLIVRPRGQRAKPTPATDSES